jgi:carbonic anhydrase
MKHSTLLFVAAIIVLPHYGCDAKSNSVERGREAVKDIVTQPVNALENAKSSLKESEQKSKASLEQEEKQSN